MDSKYKERAHRLLLLLAAHWQWTANTKKGLTAYYSFRCIYSKVVNSRAVAFCSGRWLKDGKGLASLMVCEQRTRNAWIWPRCPSRIVPFTITVLTWWHILICSLKRFGCNVNISLERHLFFGLAFSTITDFPMTPNKTNSRIFQKVNAAGVFFFLEDSLGSRYKLKSFTSVQN